MTSGGAQPENLAPVSDAVGLPVSVNQEVLLAYWEIDRSAGRQVPINRVEAVIIRGDVDVRALSEAFAALVTRHSVLRSRFEPTPGMPPALRRLQLDAFARTGVCPPGLYQQSLVACAEARLRTIDPAGASASTDDRLLEELVWTERCRPFDYTTPPLIRGTLLRRGRADLALVIAVPWLVCDQDSVEILLSDLFRLYEQAVDPGCGGRLPPASQFHDFAVRQSELAFTSHFDRATAYWRQRWEALESCQIDPAELNYAQREALHGAYGSISETLTLSEPVSAAIRTYAERSEVAPFVLFMAAYGLFLRAATGRPRLAVWMNCANRADDESDGTVGWLANRHAVEIDTSSAPDVEEIVEACRRGVVQALSHQELPLPLLWYRLGRHLARRGPPVKLTWRSGSIYRGAGMQVTRLEADVCRLPLSMGMATAVSEHEQGFAVTMVHAEGRFRRSETRPALLRFCALMETMALGRETTVVQRLL